MPIKEPSNLFRPATDKSSIMEKHALLALASESCHVAAFALVGGSLPLALLALEDAENLLRLQAGDATVLYDRPYSRSYTSPPLGTLISQRFS
jgi:hypothetical protein